MGGNRRGVQEPPAGGRYRTHHPGFHAGARAKVRVVKSAEWHQQFQIWAAASSVEPSVGLMVDALRLSALPNRRCCRVDKARPTVFGMQHVGYARRIHQESRETRNFGIAGVAGRVNI